MAEIKWIRLDVNISDDKKIKMIRKMPNGDSFFTVWVFLMAEAGRTNDGGFVYFTEAIPYTTEMLSDIWNMSRDIIVTAFVTFEKYEMISIDDDGFIKLLNWGEHQFVDSLEKIREQNRDRKRKQRERQKKEPRNSHVTGHGTITGGHAIELELELELDKELNNDDDNAFKTIENYLAKKMGVLSVRGKDIPKILDLAQEKKFPLQTILKAIDYAFENYEPEFDGDKINSISYVLPIIEQFHARNGAGPQKDRTNRTRGNRSVKPKSEYVERIKAMEEEKARLRAQQPKDESDDLPF